MIRKTLLPCALVLLVNSCGTPIPVQPPEGKNRAAAMPSLPQNPDTTATSPIWNAAIDTVGCVTPDERGDTLLHADKLALVVSFEEHCIPRLFTDTTIAVNGDDIVFTTVHAYNYREIIINMVMGDHKKQFTIRNEDLRDSIPFDFLRRGMLGNSKVIRLLPGDTTLLFRTSLYVPGDDHYDIVLFAPMHGKLQVAHTYYEGAF
jgi:hypothetical protein